MKKLYAILYPENTGISRRNINIFIRFCIVQTVVFPSVVCSLFLFSNSSKVCKISKVPLLFSLLSQIYSLNYRETALLFVAHKICYNTVYQFPESPDYERRDFFENRALLSKQTKPGRPLSVLPVLPPESGGSSEFGACGAVHRRVPILPVLFSRLRPVPHGPEGHPALGGRVRPNPDPIPGDALHHQ